jgi:hypothetical protein
MPRADQTLEPYGDADEPQHGMTSSSRHTRHAAAPPLLPVNQRLQTQHSSNSRRQRSKTLLGNSNHTSSSSRRRSSSSDTGGANAAGGARQRIAAHLLNPKAALACCSAAVGLLLGAWAVLSVQHMHTQVRMHTSVYDLVHGETQHPWQFNL